MLKGGHVYMMCSPNRTTIYIGVSSELITRVWQHRTKYRPGSFTAKYNCIVLVYYAYFDSIEAAIVEEKRLKGHSRKEKERLIELKNPNWFDLWDEINF